MTPGLSKAIAELGSSSAAVATVTIAAPLPAALDGTRETSTRELGPILRWEDPAPDGDGFVWSFAAIGEAALVEGSGEGSLDEVKSAAGSLFASLSASVHPEASFAPPVRLHGGIAFRPEAKRAGPWAAFRDASFALPRVLYGTSADRAFVRVARRAGEAVDAAWIAAAVDALTRPRPREDPRDVDARLERGDADAWRAMIDDALLRIRAHELEKVVPMTRCKVATSGTLLDPGAALDRLADLYPECVRFAFQRGDAVFMGASPERLLLKRGLAVASDALAGSAPRRPGAEAHAAAALLESDKDRREHQVVVDAIRSALAAHSARVKVPSVPVVRTLRNVHHLWTPITATLAKPIHVLDLVRSLHPTPAVCGTPREAAIAWIAGHERETRGWYAGAVGWFDADGDGAFSVAIRSGVIARHEAWLYAGAGIVEGSDAALELAETRTKQAPMLTALGLSP